MRSTMATRSHKAGSRPQLHTSTNKHT